jgi:hypothetical protein
MHSTIGRLHADMGLDLTVERIWAVRTLSMEIGVAVHSVMQIVVCSPSTLTCVSNVRRDVRDYVTEYTLVVVGAFTLAVLQLYIRQFRN